VKPGEKACLLYVSDDVVRNTLSVADVIDTVREVYRAHGAGESGISTPAAQFLKEGDRQPTYYKVKGASLPAQGIVGFRIIGNSLFKAPGKPWTYRYCYLADPETARPLALIDETYQSFLRTGVTGAVTLSLLGRKDAGVAGIVGAGNIARYLLDGLSRLFTLRQVRVYSRTEASQGTFTRQMASLLKIPVEAVESVEQAVTDSDLVVTLTDADEALVLPGWLKKGATLCSMGNNQELDAQVLFEVDKFVVDELDFCRSAGDVHAWISKGYLQESEIVGRLYGTVPEIMAGRKPGRQSPAEKILAVVQGMAACDLALAHLVYQRVRDSAEVQRITL
jgi:ornithine cyclodeaminase